MIDDNNLGSISRVFLSGLIVILSFYSLPIVINYTNEKILNTNEFRNNSKTVLAYTLEKKGHGNLDDDTYD